MAGGVITAAWVSGLLQGVPILVAAGVAFYGLNGWRAQVQGNRISE